MVFYFQRKMTKDFFWRSTININKTLTVSFSMSCSCNASHKFWYQSPSPHYQCCLQVSEAGCWRKLFQYVATLSRGRELTSFCKVDNSRISINSSRNWFSLNNLCEMMKALLNPFETLGSWCLNEILGDVLFIWDNRL